MYLVLQQCSAGTLKDPLENWYLSTCMSWTDEMYVCMYVKNLKMSYTGML